MKTMMPQVRQIALELADAGAHGEINAMRNAIQVNVFHELNSLFVICLYFTLPV